MKANAARAITMRLFIRATKVCALHDQHRIWTEVQHPLANHHCPPTRVVEIVAVGRAHAR